MSLWMMNLKKELGRGASPSLGDFGLARLVDHELGSQTTVLAGTMGYLAPKCVTTGKASRESNVYSFGEEPSKIKLVEWVWDHYGKGQPLEVADKGLNIQFDERQIECLIVVGLWCCHPNTTIRPTIRQLLNVLNFEAPLPKLPSKLPVPIYQQLVFQHQKGLNLLVPSLLLLESHYPILFRGVNGTVAHEFIIDLRDFKVIPLAM
ncbi:l-type lectin-domain containing receptor kinase ix.1 [Quercus suber]|uniref:L-type lectin-domain containing receptor kinase ix.1 n=1 Tax=Quercus suber TaxID=58331 RepID=A0AAW0LVA1_QUESU